MNLRKMTQFDSIIWIKFEYHSFQSSLVYVYIHTSLVLKWVRSLADDQTMSIKTKTSISFTDHKGIAQSSLYNQREIWLHLYALPFFPVYMCYFYVMFFQSHLFPAPEFERFCFILIASLQAILFLSCEWNVNVKTLFTCSKTKNIHHAQLIKIITAKFNGSSALCKLQGSSEVNRSIKKSIFIN